MERLEISLIKIALSKAGWMNKIKYLLVCTIFYPILLVEEKRNKQKGKVGAQVSTDGDDVYPLF